MVGIPTFLVVVFVLLPTLASIVLSFTSWNGIGGLERDQVRRPRRTTTDLVTVYPPFWPADHPQPHLAVVFLFIATPLGIFLAVLLDKEIRGTRFYQSALYLPVVLSLAIVGLHLAAPSTHRSRGCSTTSSADRPGRTRSRGSGDPNINLWAVLVAASWRQVGYVMVLYLAGLKAVDPDAAGGRRDRRRDARRRRSSGSSSRCMRPINIVVLVITVIESLRAFDLAFIINKGLNGLELLSTLVTNNIIGETSRIGFGSAIAVVLLVVSVGPIIVYLVRDPPGGDTSDREPRDRAGRGRHDGSAARRTKRLRRSRLHAFLFTIGLVWLLPIAWAVYTSLPPVRGDRPSSATSRSAGRTTSTTT